MTIVGKKAFSWAVKLLLALVLLSHWTIKEFLRDIQPEMKAVLSDTEVVDFFDGEDMQIIHGLSHADENELSLSAFAASESSLLRQEFDSDVENPKQILLVQKVETSHSSAFLEQGSKGSMYMQKDSLTKENSVHERLTDSVSSSDKSVDGSTIDGSLSQKQMLPLAASGKSDAKNLAHEGSFGHTGDTIFFVNREAAEKSEDLSEVDHRPRNLRLAFIGDSVTRYQYVDLVYYLKTNKWIQTDENPNLLYKHTYPSWNHYLEASNNALLPEEECDCLSPVGRFFMSTYTENRYFRDEERGNYITFINKYGFRSTQGHWSPDKVYEKHGPILNSTTFKNYTWQGNWSYAIREHLAKLKPKPDFLVFNAGLHPQDLSNTTVQEDIIKALRETKITGIYKTTTFSRNCNLSTRPFRRGRHDYSLCGKVFPLCLNLSWTAFYEGDEHYFDDNHLKPHLNTRMNLELLDLLRNLSAANIEIHDKRSRPMNWRFWL